MITITRRRFLDGGAGVGSAVGVQGGVSASPNERVHLVFIGVRGMGRARLESFLSRPAAAVVVVCNVEQNVLARAGETVRKASTRDPQGAGTFVATIECLSRLGGR